MVQNMGRAEFLPPPGDGIRESAESGGEAKSMEESNRAMHEEMVLARRIQVELFPKSCPQLEGYEIFATAFPALMICGDYFDFVELDGGRHAICLGDVCGKGLSASLLMANLQAIIRTQSLYNPPGHDCLARCRSFFSAPAKQCVERTNGLLFRSTPPERFVTLFYGILDPSEHTLRFCNAGHNPPLHVSEGQARRLKTGGIPLGIKADWSYNEETLPLAPGDMVVMYSDGITEALDPEGLEFGEARLTGLIQRLWSAPPEKVAAEILSEVEKHLGGAPASDDISLLIFKRIDG